MKRRIMIVAAALASFSAVAGCAKRDTDPEQTTTTVGGAASPAASTEVPAAPGAPSSPSAPRRSVRPTSPSGGVLPATPEPTRPVAMTRTLVSGTEIQLREVNEITSRVHNVGEPVRATTTTALRDANGNVVIPEGAEFTGRVTAIKGAKTPRSEHWLRVEFDAVKIGETSFPIQTQVVSLASVLRGRGVQSKDAAKVGAGAVIGGVAGRVIGGNRTGTIIGGAAGAAAGAVYANQTRDLDMVLPAGAAITLRLERPFSREVALR